MWSQKWRRRRPTATLISTGDAGPGNTVLRPRCQHRPTPTGTRSGPPPTAAPSRSAAAGRRLRQTAPIYFLSPSTSTAPKNPPTAPRTPPTSTSPPRPAPALHRHPRSSKTIPLVLDAAPEAGTRHTADFQVTPDGEFAAFPSTLALAGRGEETAGHTEVYRYDAATEKLACVSCTPTGEPSEGDSSLASNGLSLTEDGRVFFNSTDPLVATDTDEQARRL